MTYSSFLKLSFWCCGVANKMSSMLCCFLLLWLFYFRSVLIRHLNFLAPAAAGIIWCATVLAVLMALESTFKEDHRDGSLEQLVVSGLSLPLLIVLKIIAQWLVVMLPLLITMPLLAEMLYLPSSGFWALIGTLLVGSPSLFFHWRDWWSVNGVDKTRCYVGDVANIAVLFASDYFLDVSGQSGAGRFAVLWFLGDVVGDVFVVFSYIAFYDGDCSQSECERMNWAWFHKLGSPKWFYSWSKAWALPVFCFGCLCLVIGLVWGLAFAPADYQQGNSFRIIYIHVPVAMLAQSCYLAMGIAGVVFLVLADENVAHFHQGNGASWCHYGIDCLGVWGHLG